MNTISASHHPVSKPWRIGAALVMLFHPLRAGLLVCVIIPTVVTIIYQLFIAADIHVSESGFSVRRDQGMSNADIGMILPGLQYSGGAQDQLTVNAYIHSRDMVEALKKSIDAPKIFRSDKADLVARLPEGADSEEILEYFRRMITITYDERAQISSLEVRAFTAEDAKTLNEALLVEAERFVNSLSDRIRQSGIAFARDQLAKAEAELENANEALSNFRNAHANFDPAKESEGVGNVLSRLYADIVTRKAELEALRGVMTPQNQAIRNREREIAALQRQFDQQNARLTKPDDLSGLLFDYAKLEAEHKFATKRYELALASLEAAQIEAGRQSLYLVAVALPSFPEIATEPRRLYHIASVFFLSLAAYGMALLIAASINDHIRR